MRILVVEDQCRMAELLRQGLTEDGHVVTIAPEGREALSLAGSGGFDLLILDVMLPGVSGFEIARQLRARLRAKIEEPGQGRVIRTVRDVGYCLTREAE
jgi:DNA-binding response OmpR family regulator